MIWKIRNLKMNFEVKLLESSVDHLLPTNVYFKKATGDDFFAFLWNI